jgi:molybdenum cofactor cytidylyltransferase
MTANLASSIGVISLGAGASSRMGRPKLLLPWRDTTVIGHLIRQWQELKAAQIAVALRLDDTALAAELDRLQFPKSDRIENPQPERGMFSSIVCSAHWPGWRKEISSRAIVLGDQPHLQTASLCQLLRFSIQYPDAICQPAYAGRTGHPVILPADAFSELKNSGLVTFKDFLNLTTVPRVQCNVNDSGLSLDMDTPEDYKQLKASTRVV